MKVDVAIPTQNSEDVIGECLYHLNRAATTAGVQIENLIVVDDKSEDDTVAITREKCDEYGWTFSAIVESTSLPEARMLCVENVKTDWFLFLDDDVRIQADYLQQQRDAIAPSVGAVQGRKIQRQEHPSKWVRRRSRRGGTHATLMRTEAVSPLSIPDDVTVLEDEYIRRTVEENSYLWIFDHQARFRHENQDRHPIGWTEGRVAGKYNLKPLHEYLMNIPFSVATGRNPIPHCKRTLGWIAGRVEA